jgi:hypothetical protein
VRRAPHPSYSSVLEGGYEGGFLAVSQIKDINKVDGMRGFLSDTVIF